MSGVTNRLTGQSTDQQATHQPNGLRKKRRKLLLKRNQKYLISFALLLMTSLTTVQHANAENYVGEYKALLHYYHQELSLY